MLAALREAAARSRSGRVWLVLAEAGDRDPAWGTAMGAVRRVTRRGPPRLVLVGSGADAGARS